MRQTIIFSTLFLFSIIATGQNAFYDAVTLKRFLLNKNLSIDNNKSEQTIVLSQKIMSLKADIPTINDTSLVRKKTDTLTNLENALKASKGLTRDTLSDILSKYFPGIDITNAASAATKANANPFFNDLMLTGNTVGKNSISNVSKGLFKSVGGLDVTKYANAISDLMIERAKQELTVAFFDRFKKFAEINPEFKILFPKTTDNLTNLLSYKYPQMLPALRAGFFEDLKQITYHLDDVLDLPRYQTLLRDYPQVKMAIRSIRVIHELETGASNAADVIKQISTFTEWNDANRPKMRSAGSCLTIAALFSESVRNDTTKSHKDDIWISAKELKALFYDETLFNIYLGLIYQQAVNENINYIDQRGNVTPFSTILAAQIGNFFILQNKLKEFFDLTANVNNAFQSFKAKTENNLKPTDDDIYNYIRTSIDAIDFGFSIVKIFHQQPMADDYIAIARKSNDIFKSIYTRQYSLAVSNALEVLSQLNSLVSQEINFEALKSSVAITGYSGTAKNDVEKLAEGSSFFRLKKVGEKNIANVINANIAVPEVQKMVQHYDLKKLNDFLDKLKPYALFMANMVEAKDESAVKAALENVILPVGSSSIKKKTYFNISVQSYLGAYLSVNKKNTAVSSTWKDRFGVTAPIGISFTPGLLSWERGGAISLFTSLIDLGAIVDYKLKKENTVNEQGQEEAVVTKDYSVKLGQIFSPGVYVVYGFFENLPLSLGFGTQYGPGLSKITAGDNPVVTNPSWRWNVFLAVDMPFFNLVNKGTRRK